MLSYNDLEDHLSSQRLYRYLTACANNKVRTIQLYKANMKVSKAFHPLLCIFEVVLRNQINLKLAAYFRDSDWILNQRTRFMSDASLSRGGFFLKNEVDNTVRKLSRGGSTPNSGKVIADLNFGFWTALFLPHHFNLLGGRLFQVFSNHPHRSLTRGKISRNVNLIRDFRNRTNHNEPICFRGIDIDFTNASDTYKAIRRTLRWIDPRLLSLVKEFDFVLEEIREARAI